MEEVSNLYIISDFTYTSKYENLAMREFSDIVWSKSLCFLLHMYFRITNANIANYGTESKCLVPKRGWDICDNENVIGYDFICCGRASSGYFRK